MAAQMSAPPKDLRRFRSRGVAGVVGVAVALCAATTCASAPAEDCAVLQVTIHNENSGQNFSPPVVVVHRPGFSLFRVGEPASESLWRLAEDGQTDGYTALAGTHPDVVAVVVAPPAHRKRSPVVSTAITACAGQRVSVAAMLGATNDGFVAARDVQIPDAPGEVVRAALSAFDAGSEANTEKTTHATPMLTS